MEGSPTVSTSPVIVSIATPAPEAEGAVAPNLLVYAIPNGFEPPSYLAAPLVQWRGLGDGFGAARASGLVHGGIDFLLDNGANVPVYALCDGHVSDIGQTRTFGLYVTLDCGNGWTVILANLAQGQVAVNDAAVAGETIVGAVGDGSVPGSLHLAVRADGLWVDPVAVVPLQVRPGDPRPATPTPEGLPSRVRAQPTPTPAPSSATTSVIPATVGPVASATPVPPVDPTVTNTPNLTPTRIPTRAPTATPTLRPPTPTPTELPRAF